jgi:hypothetical protein
MAGNQFSFTVNGTSGALYAVQTTTNLSAGPWLGVETNAAPFVFTQANAAAVGERFYRVVVP